MTGKSLPNDFQYTKLKYKQHPYFSLNIPFFFFCYFCFVSIQFLYQSLFLFCFLSLNSIHFCLMYYQDNNTEHHKFIYPPYSINFQVLQKKQEKKTTKILLLLATKRLCSLLITGNHYSLLIIQIVNGRHYLLLVIQISSSSQISSRKANF